MVANIKSGASPGGALYYNKEKVDKRAAEVLFCQKMLPALDAVGRLNMEACMESFRPYLQANQRTSNTVFHASLNPSPEDKLTDSQLREIAQEYMARMGYGEQPYIVFKHRDIEREHLHIVSLRIRLDGRKLPHDFEARRSMEILRSLEQKYGLHPAVKGEEQAEKSGLRKVNYPEGDVKQQISSVIRACLGRYKCASYGEFRTLLETFNVSVEERTGTIDGRDYAGIIYGAMTDEGYGVGTPFKASRIGRDVEYKALERYYQQSANAIRQDGALAHTRDAVRLAMRCCDTKDEFRQMLRGDGIDAVFRVNPVGRIYGATFIDHKEGIVANGSVLGREFSANTFNQRYPEQHLSAELEQEREQNGHRSQVQTSVESASEGITIWELFDIQAFEEQQIKKRRKKKKFCPRP